MKYLLPEATNSTLVQVKLLLYSNFMAMAPSVPDTSFIVTHTDVWKLPPTCWALSLPRWFTVTCIWARLLLQAAHCSPNLATDRRPRQLRCIHYAQGSFDLPPLTNDLSLYSLIASCCQAGYTMPAPGFPLHRLKSTSFTPWSSRYTVQPRECLFVTIFLRTRMRLS